MQWVELQLGTSVLSDWCETKVTGWEWFALGFLRGHAVRLVWALLHEGHILFGRGHSYAESLASRVDAVWHLTLVCCCSVRQEALDRGLIRWELRWWLAV